MQGQPTVGTDPSGEFWLPIAFCGVVGATVRGALGPQGRRKRDLVAADGGDLFVALGNGDGTFQTPAAYSGRGSAAIGDIDSNSRPDLVTTDSANNAVRLFLDGPSPNPINFATGSTNGRVQIRKSSDGSVMADFAPFGSAFTGPVNVAWGDVNGDGFRDLAVAAGAGNPQVKVYDGRAIAQGTFSAAYPTIAC